MERAIKFRAWDKARHQMFEVTQLEWSAYTTQAFSSLELLSIDGNYTAQHIDGLTTIIRDIYEIMQFTGLKDKNGKEIYEGDIVKAYPKYGWPEDNQRVVIYAVVFSEFEGCWALKDERKIEDCPSLYRSGIYSRRDEQLEIIGNIYENPELVEMRG